MNSGRQPAKYQDYTFIMVLALSFLLGMAVALAVYLLWRFHDVPSQFEHLFTGVALFVCPPFILTIALGPAPDVDLAFVLAVGTIIFANAFLYAGVAAGLYAVFRVLWKKRRDGRIP